MKEPARTQGSNQVSGCFRAIQSVFDAVLLAGISIYWSRFGNITSIAMKEVRHIAISLDLVTITTTNLVLLLMVSLISSLRVVYIYHDHYRNYRLRATHEVNQVLKLIFFRLLQD
jgi:hypothetical protein